MQKFLSTQKSEYPNYVKKLEANEAILRGALEAVRSDAKQYYAVSVNTLYLVDEALSTPPGPEDWHFKHAENIVNTMPEWKKRFTGKVSAHPAR